MAKLTPEQLKQIRINNLSKGRMGKGRPRGVKNNITSQKVNELIIKFLDQEENKTKTQSDIINTAVTLNLTAESTKQQQQKLQINKHIKKSKTYN